MRTTIRQEVTEPTWKTVKTEYTCDCCDKKVTTDGDSYDIGIDNLWQDQWDQYGHDEDTLTICNECMLKTVMPALAAVLIKGRVTVQPDLFYVKTENSWVKQEEKKP